VDPLTLPAQNPRRAAGARRKPRTSRFDHSHGGCESVVLVTICQAGALPHDWTGGRRRLRVPRGAWPCHCGLPVGTSEAHGLPDIALRCFALTGGRGGGSPSLGGSSMILRWPIISGAGLPLVGTLVAVTAITHTGAPPRPSSAPTPLTVSNPTAHSGSSTICDGDNDWDDQSCGSTGVGTASGAAGTGGSGGSTSPGGGTAGSGAAGSSGGSTSSGGGSSVGGGSGTTAPGSSGTTGTGAGNPATCYSGAWPLTSTPVPPGSAGGVYLRSNGDGVYLEVTHRGGRAVVYSGTLTSDGTLSANPYKLEADDHFSVSPDGHTITFRFANFGALDGMAIGTTCGGYITLQADSGHQPSRWVHSVGRTTGQPAQSLNAPVTVTRSS